MREILKDQSFKLLYGLIAIFIFSLIFGLIFGIVTLIMLTHGVIKLAIIVITILVIALLIGNDRLQ